MDQIISLPVSSCGLSCHSHPHTAGTWAENSPRVLMFGDTWVAWHTVSGTGSQSPGRTLTGAYLVLSTQFLPRACKSECKQAQSQTKSSVVYSTAFQEVPSEGLPSQPSFPFLAHTDSECQLFQTLISGNLHTQANPAASPKGQSNVHSASGRVFNI